MANNNSSSQLIKDLEKSNKRYISENKKELAKCIDCQKPKIAVITCSDSRVIPELIFNKSIGEIFVVRVAGNVAFDSSVLTSLEYTVDHLNIELLIILGHTNCGAVKAAEESTDNSVELFEEIKQSFSIDSNHIRSNVLRQIEMIPKRSKIIRESLKQEKISIIGAIYHLENGLVTFF